MNRIITAGDRARAGDRIGAAMARHALLGGDQANLEAFWHFDAHRPHIINAKTGAVEWEHLWEETLFDPERQAKLPPGSPIDECNIVVNQGLNHLLDVHFHVATQITTWFIALTKTLGGSPVAADTYVLFMGTANEEVIAYDESVREAFIEGAPSGQSIDNVGNEAVFTISGDTTVIGGGALVTLSTKNNNAAGPFMYSAGAFTAGDKSLDTADTLTVTLTLTAADDGA